MRLDSIGLASLPEEEETRDHFFPTHTQKKGHVRTQPEGECRQVRKRGLTRNQPC